jgi:hypothetical protein
MRYAAMQTDPIRMNSGDIAVRSLIVAESIKTITSIGIVVSDMLFCVFDVLYLAYLLATVANSKIGKDYPLSAVWTSFVFFHEIN